MRPLALFIVLILSVATPQAAVTVAVDPATEHQIIEGFGANQPQYYYATDYFGGAILDLAFKRSGMGMTVLRCDMPLGFEGVQGTSAGNDNADPDVIDWNGFDTSVLAPMAAVAQGAAARGCQSFICVPWSPPYWMKTNGSETGGGSLLTGMETELAEYFRAYLLYMGGATGEVNPPVMFDYVTIQNEPEISPSFWGCTYTASRLAYVMEIVAGKLRGWEFPGMTVAAPDNATISTTRSYLTTVMGDPEAEAVTGLISVHPYELSWTNPDGSITAWTNYRNQVVPYDRKSWVPEHCDAEYGAADITRTNWTSGLNGATHIHRALVNGGVNSWSFWTLFRRNADQYDSGYGHSLWYSESFDGNATLKATGKVSAFTPFYRYVRPGYKRVAASPADTSTNLRVTAFKAPGGVDSGLVIVVINRGTTAAEINGSIANPGAVTTLRRCEAAEYTSGGTTRHGVRGGAAVTLSGGAFTTTVPAKSVTAFVHEAGSPWPTAAFADQVSGLSVTVDASTSTPGSIERYEWDFGDGGLATGVTAGHTYAAAGSYTVTLTVTEAMGGVSTVSRAISVYEPDGSIAGTVLYYRDAGGGEPGSARVGNATLRLQGETFSRTTLSDPTTGAYAFADLPSEDIVVTLDKTGGFAGISSYDAALASQFRVGMIGLTTHQQTAGDVSGNGAISSYDAALISQFRVGMISRFPVATALGSDWAFAPSSRSYLPLDSDKSGEDYLGILYGDISGNWSPSGTEREAIDAGDEPRPVAAGDRSPSAAGGAPRTDPALISLRGWEGMREPGEARTLVVALQRADGIVGIDLDLHYDPAQLSISGVRPVGLGSSLQSVSHDLGGTLRIAMYGSQPLHGSGKILEIAVEARGRPGGGPPIRIEARANEGAIPVRPLPTSRAAGRPGTRGD